MVLAVHPNARIRDEMDLPSKDGKDMELDRSHYLLFPIYFSRDEAIKTALTFLGVASLLSFNNIL